MNVRRNILTALAVVTITSSVWAANTVKVIEGGGPMTLTLDRPTTTAGETTFMVQNDAVAEEHEMVLVKLRSADQKIDVIASKHRVDVS